jgi:hypothetical protein
MRWALWGGVAVVIIGVLVWWKTDPSGKRALREAEAELNRRTPWTIAPGVSVDKAYYDTKKSRFDIYYTVKEFKAGEVPTQTMHAALKKAMTQQVCGNAAMRKALNGGVAFLSIWHGGDGREVAQVSVGASDCP